MAKTAEEMTTVVEVSSEDKKNKSVQPAKPLVSV